MKYRRFGRSNWQVSEIGYGMWGMAGWTGSDLKEINDALDLSVEMGCNFYDTAWAYAAGKSEHLLGELIKRQKQTKLYAATKIPPKNHEWPSKGKAEEVYPFQHIIDYTEKSLKNLGLECIDLQQLHVWDDSWSTHDDWKKAVEKLKKEGKITAFGLSLNRWEPNNSLQAIQTGLVDSVQLIYNIFDQNPEDQLLPLCEKMDIAVIARVPFDEGTLTGTFTKETTFPEDDWRSKYFVPENLISSVEHADALKPLIPAGMTMADMALRFILENKTISTTIPGMRKIRNVKNNLSCSDGNRLAPTLVSELKKHRWDRVPTEWSM
jgi:aryl-alcohol dehydrogenase-like predicted oxidoreductase